MSEPTKVKERAEHTPGTWRVDVLGHFGTINVTTNARPVAMCGTQRGRAEDEANARRIVACVNACEGIDNEWLEVNSGMLQGHDHALERERDQLRERVGELENALTNILSAAEQMRHGGYRDSFVASYDGHAYEARVALAKVRP